MDLFAHNFSLHTKYHSLIRTCQPPSERCKQKALICHPPHQMQNKTIKAKNLPASESKSRRHLRAQASLSPEDRRTSQSHMCKRCWIKDFLSSSFLLSILWLFLHIYPDSLGRWPAKDWALKRERRVGKWQRDFQISSTKTSCERTVRTIHCSRAE